MSTASKKRFVHYALVLAVLTGIAYPSLWICRRPELPVFRGANVVLLVVDSLRPDHLGLYGYKRNTSPFLDEFAKQAVVFDNAVSQSSWTGAAMGSLFTSLYPHEHGAVRKKPLPDAVVTMAEYLRARGYKTHALQTNPLLAPPYKFQQGFDYYDYRHEHYSADALNRLFERFKPKPSDRFFLYWHLMDAHSPYQPKLEYLKLFAKDSGLPNKFPWDGLKMSEARGYSPPFGETEKEHARDLYDAEVRSLDTQLQRFFETLKKRGLLDNTLVIFLADHGEEFWEHGRWEHGHSMFNEVLKVPLIISHPKFPLRGVRRSQLVSLVDIFPTVVGMLDEMPLQRQRGRDLREELFRDRPYEGSVFSEDTIYGSQQQALQGRRYKLISDAEKRESQLYYLAADPAESAPIRDAGMEKKLTGALAALRDAGRAPAGANDTAVALDQETLKALQSLGYIN